MVGSLGYGFCPIGLYQEAWEWGTILEPQLFSIDQMETRAEPSMKLVPRL